MSHCAPERAVVRVVPHLGLAECDPERDRDGDIVGVRVPVFVFVAVRVVVVVGERVLVGVNVGDRVRLHSMRGVGGVRCG